MVDPFESYLEEFSPDIIAISKRLRGVIQKGTPGAVEVFSPDLKHLSYALSEASDHKVILLAPKKNFVLLVFQGSKQLKDIDGLLGSEGKQDRFMTVKTLEEADRPALSQLIEAAWTNATARVAE